MSFFFSFLFPQLKNINGVAQESYRIYFVLFFVLQKVILFFHLSGVEFLYNGPFQTFSIQRTIRPMNFQK